METQIASTPFGSRPMSLALMTAQRQATQIPPGKTVDKWQIYRSLCAGKKLIGVSDRSLAVLSALLSFHPDAELSEDTGLIVFPSNRQLALRAHGMPDTTLRRHLSALVECKLILRRDSPNGKRYARKGRGGELKEAFGFSLAPLLLRAEEFRQAAELVSANNRAIKLLREKITLLRRDIAKLIEAALKEELAGDWHNLHNRFRSVVEALPRRANPSDLEPFLADLLAIRDDIDKALDLHTNDKTLDGNESQNGRQHSNSDTKIPNDSELAPDNEADPGQHVSSPYRPIKTCPLDLVLKACPAITDYAPQGITSWRELETVTAQVRKYLGISNSAYADAIDTIGRENTAAIIACLLERTSQITSPGGYLRILIEKAAIGRFSIGPMVVALLKAKNGVARACLSTEVPLSNARHVEK